MFPRGELVRAALAVIAVLVSLALLWQTRMLILLTVLGVLLGLAATPAVDWLEKRRIKRGVGSPMVVLGVILAIGGVGLWSAPTIVSQVEGLRQQVPAAIDKLDVYLEREHRALLDAVLPRYPVDSAAAADPATAGSVDTGRLRSAISRQASQLRGLAFGAVTSTLAVFVGLMFVMFLTIYFAIEPYAYRRGLLLLFSEATRPRAAVLFDAVTATLRKWLATQFIAMLVVGVVTMIVLFLLDVKSAIPLGILAGILEFVPNLGPIMAAIPAVLISFGDSPQKALLVGFAYWAIQFLENNVLIPILMREELDLPPALVLLWQAVMALVFGLLGLFVAVPLLAATMVAVRYLHVRGDVPPVRRPRGSREIAAMPDDFASP
jgi:predicted PurR-regulated permease PerM